MTFCSDCGGTLDGYELCSECDTRGEQIDRLQAEVERLKEAFESEQQKAIDNKARLRDAQAEVERSNALVKELEDEIERLRSYAQDGWNHNKILAKRLGARRH